jgi:hypothetical protein
MLFYLCAATAVEQVARIARPRGQRQLFDRSVRDFAAPWVAPPLSAY